MNSNRVAIPTVVRIKSGALARLGIYLSRFGHQRVAVFQSAGLGGDLSNRARESLHSAGIEAITWVEVNENEQHRSNVIARLFERTGFWDAIAADPFSAVEWREAVRRAPAMKEDFFTVLSTRDTLPEVTEAIRNDPWLVRCFVD